MARAIKPGRVTAPCESITPDGLYVRCKVCGAPISNSKGYETGEHQRLHARYEVCVKESESGWCRSYEDFHMYLDRVREATVELRAACATRSCDELLNDYDYIVNLDYILGLAYTAFYTGGLWVQNWEASLIMPRAQYIRLLWNTPRFRVWAASLMPLELYAAFCNDFWCDRAWRYVSGFDDVPFIPSKVIASPFCENPFKLVKDSALWVGRDVGGSIVQELPSRLFEGFAFDPDWVPVPHTFDDEKLKVTLSRLQAGSVARFGLLGGPCRKLPEKLSGVDKRLLVL